MAVTYILNHPVYIYAHNIYNIIKFTMCIPLAEESSVLRFSTFFPIFNGHMNVNCEFWKTLSCSSARRAVR